MTDAASPRTKLPQAVLMAAAMPLLLLSAYVHFLTAGAAGAKGWLLLAGRMMVSGKKLYVDIIEVNPPLIIWIDAIPGWIAMRESFLSDAHVLVVMGFLAVALSIAMCLRLIRAHPAFAQDPWRRRWFAVLLAYVFVFFTTSVYFFDREHIILLMTFPYIVRFMPGLARAQFPRPVSAMVGCMGALGFCMKPHAALVFVTLQVLYILRERSLAILWSLENLLIYAGVALYFFCVWQFAREYLTVVMPMAIPTYHMYSRPRSDSLYFVIPVLIVLALTFIDFRRHASPFRSDVPYFLGVCLGFLFYALANNGWGYTYNPLICASLITCGWVWMEYRWLRAEQGARGLPVKQFIFGARSCAMVFAFGGAFFLLCFFSYFFTFDCHKSDSCHNGASLFVQASKYPKHSFGTMSVNDPTFWAEVSEKSGASWDTRFSALFMMPSYMAHGPEFQKKYHWMLDYVSHGYAEDLDRWKPDTMFVDISPLLFGNFRDADLVALLSYRAEFTQAWSHYSRVGTIDSCPPAEPANAKQAGDTDCRFAVYQRRD